MVASKKRAIRRRSVEHYVYDGEFQPRMRIVPRTEGEKGLQDAAMIHRALRMATVGMGPLLAHALNFWVFVE
jgi:hypothetical protein